jgi:hypothetical protein
MIIANLPAPMLAKTNKNNDPCQALQKKLTINLAKKQPIGSMQLLALANCQLKSDNALKCRAAKKPCGKTIVVTGDPKSKTKPQQAQIIDVGDEKSIATSCAAIAQTVGAKSGDPRLLILAGPAGAYTCDSYLKAAARKDPLLIIAPTMVPAVELAKTTQAAVRAEADRVVEAAKKNPIQAALVPNQVIGVASINVAREILKTIPGAPVPPPLPEVNVTKTLKDAGIPVPWN